MDLQFYEAVKFLFFVQDIYITSWYNNVSINESRDYIFSEFFQKFAKGLFLQHPNILISFMLDKVVSGIQIAVFRLTVSFFFVQIFAFCPTRL